MIVFVRERRKLDGIRRAELIDNALKTEIKFHQMKISWKIENCKILLSHQTKSKSFS